MNIDKFRNLLHLKFGVIFKNFYLGIGSITTVIFSVVLQVTLSNAAFNGQKDQFILNMTVFFNSIMSAIMMISIPIAQEKERNRLKVSVADSNNHTEYLFITLIPVFLIIMVINMALPLLSGVQMKLNSYILYMIITTILTIMSLVIGLLIGISSKKISETSYIIVYTILFLILIPQIGTLNGTFERMSDFIYTGVLLKIMMKISMDQPVIITITPIAIIVIEFVLLIALFIIIIRDKEWKINQ